MESSYAELSDEEIIAKIRKNDTGALEYIFEKYKNLVRAKARKLFLIGGDGDDLIQEGMIGLYRAVSDYNPQKDASFSTFANLCVSRQLFDAIRASNRQKNIPLNTCISLNTPAFDENQDEYHLAEDSNPESMLIAQETIQMLEELCQEILSDFENEVMKYYLSGMTYQEIAVQMEKEPKSIDNALHRIKSKLRKQWKRNEEK